MSASANTARLLPLIAVAVLLTAAQHPTVTPIDTGAYAREIESWHRDRLERLTAEDGWLTLIGLFWLSEGANLVGSDESATVRLPPSKAARRVAIIHLQGERLRLEVVPGKDVRHAGRAVTALKLRPDNQGEPTVLEVGDLSFFVIHRAERYAVRVRDRFHPARLQFAGVERFPVDPSWRIAARLEPYEPPKRIPIPNVLGTVDEELSPGAVVFVRGARTHRIDALSGPEGRLFLVFADETTGQQTYGGGRFLYSQPVQEDRSVVVDFNLAYNPPCAFTDFATCPLPPRQNRLRLRIEAGEKSFHRPH